MNSDQLMEQALGDYFDSLLSEAPAVEEEALKDESPELASLEQTEVKAAPVKALPSESSTLQEQTTDQSALDSQVSAEHTSTPEAAAISGGEVSAPSPHSTEAREFSAAVEQERELDSSREGARAKPLATLFEEAQQRIAKPTSEEKAKPPAEPKPSLLPITELPPAEAEPVVEEVKAEQVEISNEAEVAEVPPAPPEPEWQNLETDNEFQVLFFEAAGVTFGVPLTHLGGIHRITEVSPLFGKPPWFSGIMIEREQKLSVVDTAKWVMPGQPFNPEYKYIVMLGDTEWGMSCERLLGTEKVNKEDIKWRKSPGERPWLAGMVKKKMCALLHVEELQLMLARGVDIEGH